MNTELRYEADGAPPVWLVLGQGAQIAVLTINVNVMLAVVAFRSGGADHYLLWGVFATVFCCGVGTILQALRFSRVGAGYSVLAGVSAISVPICATALASGGPALLASLVMAAALLQVAISTRLSLVRRLLTPAVTGTIIMLAPVSVMPALAGLLNQVPAEAPLAAAPVCALVTVAFIVGIGLKGNAALRLWAPVIGVVAGAVAGALFGIYETQRVAEASWIGMSVADWPGLDLAFGAEFWALLPAFAFISLLAVTRSIGTTIATQQLSWRRPRAVDFRAVQGGIAAEGTSNLLAGLMGGAPNTAYPVGASVIELTGVAARRVGFAAGAFLALVACVPKALAIVIAIPKPVVAAAVGVVMIMVFVVGLREVTREGLDYSTGLIVGVSFWVGVGFQAQLIFPDILGDFAGGLFGNGMVAGGVTVILLTLAVNLTQPRSQRYTGRAEAVELTNIQAFLAAYADRHNWDDAMRQRLAAAAEEALAAVLESEATESEEGDGAREARQLQLTVRGTSAGATLELVTAVAGEENLQDRIALLSEEPAGETTRDLSLRLLRHFASSVRHQQFHNADVLTVQVDGQKR